MNLIRLKIPVKFCFSIIRPYFKYKKGTMNLSNCDRMIDGMEGFPKKKLDDMGTLSFGKYYKKDLYSEMVSLIREYQKAGIPVILATSSPRFVVEPYFDFLGADHLIATELAFDDKGMTSGQFDGPVAFDTGKRELIESYMNAQGYDPAACAFYSDSIHDLPTLMIVGEPVAVNPDRELRAKAIEKGWDILDYS